MNKLSYLCIIFLMLSGCAEWQAIKSGIGSYGAEASDEVLDSAIWTICSAAPIGSHKRRFKTDDELKALEVLCAAQ